MTEHLQTTDTICAISTPAGRGGIAVARISGPDAIAITNKLWKGKKLTSVDSHTAHLGSILNPDGTTLDQAVATVFLNPRSFTGENVVEIAVHGSTFIQQQLIDNLVASGCRVAEPGEFTRRAFVNQRLDLAEAEAVADIIAASSRAAHRLAITQLQGNFSANINVLREKLINLASLLELELDFSEEDVTFADRSQLRTLAVDIRSTVNRLASTFHSGEAISHGIPVAIIGRPNAGKSSLLNALLQSDRAIVSDIPGTTRDTVEDTLDINGITFRFIDTAGLHSTDDPIETLGIERALKRAGQAHIIIWLVTPGESDLAEIDQLIASEKQPQTHLLLALNKIDQLDSDVENQLTQIAEMVTVADSQIAISARQHTNIEQLRQTIADIATRDLPDDESMIVTNARHYQALTDAAVALGQLLEGLDADITPDLLAFHLRAAINSLSSITGQISSSTILETIFSRFCIGK